MRYVEAGGVRLSVIGLGTWQFGSAEWGYGEDYARTTAGQLVRRALDLGINLIDTAEIYGMGRSERIVGEAIAGRRDEAFVATKVFPVLPISPVVQWRGVQSARRLGVSHLDLYQVHWPNPVVPLPTTMRGMRALLEVGLVRHVGVSNFDVAWWRRAERALGSPVLTNQVQYSLACRKPDRAGGVVPYAQQHDRLVIAYSPLAQGLLGARYDASHPPSGSARAGNPLFLPENLEMAQGLIDALRTVARSHDATPAQVALAWVIRRPNVVAIPGASSIEQLERNAEAADLELSDDDDAWLTDESDRFRPVRGVAALPGLLAARRAAGRPSGPAPVDETAPEEVGAEVVDFADSDA
ncbi:aldo/keto reductase [Rhabdothermincola sp.]|uniref:aldo/keto reductase n=1 Tax=Rhabdothermincola sp. TaxID=2820405 RepID=UPI002FDF68D6